jgi:hypothetical protein
MVTADASKIDAFVDRSLEDFIPASADVDSDGIEEVRVLQGPSQRMQTAREGRRHPSNLRRDPP